MKQHDKTIPWADDELANYKGFQLTYVTRDGVISKVNFPSGTRMSYHLFRQCGGVPPKRIREK